MDHPFDARAADEAWFALAIVNAPAPFICAAVVAPIYVHRIDVERRAVRDRFGEHIENGAMKAWDATRREFRRADERIRARQKHRFRRIDVTKSNHFRLIYERLFERAP